MVQGKASSPRPRRHAVINTLSLIAGLCLMIVAQFVIFPLLFTFFVDDPYRSQNHYSHLLPMSPLTSSSSSSTSNYIEQNRLQRRANRPPSDGTFNGAPIYLKTVKKPRSHVHCVGENYRRDAWKYRSCRFSMLCFNTSAKDFVVYQTDNERLLSVFMAQRIHAHSSTTLMRFGSNRSNTVSIGGINQKWGEEGIDRLEWFPKIIHKDYTAELTYYELPEDIVLVPFHSLNGANPGHLVWDDFLPIYTLLDMFQLIPNRDVLPLRYVLTNGERGLWASCDLRKEKTEDCNRMFAKFFPLMWGRNSPYKFTSSQDFLFEPSGTAGSDLVCAKTAVAGIGSLTDHGVIKSHGWDENDYTLTHNHGRGGVLFEFRRFMLENLGVTPQRRAPNVRPHRIVFSMLSSDIFNRKMDFERQIELIRKSFPQEQVDSYVFKELSLEEQIDIATQTSIYFTLCGGGAVTAMFLPRGSSVIVFYDEDAGFNKAGKPSGKPALLDWDLFNSMSHLRVHWLPRDTMQEKIDERTLVLLVQHELEIIESQAFT